MTRFTSAGESFLTVPSSSLIEVPFWGSSSMTVPRTRPPFVMSTVSTGSSARATETPTDAVRNAAMKRPSLHGRTVRRWGGATEVESVNRIVQFTPFPEGLFGPSVAALSGRPSSRLQPKQHRDRQRLRERDPNPSGLDEVSALVHAHGARKVEEPFGGRNLVLSMLTEPQAKDRCGGADEAVGSGLPGARALLEVVRVRGVEHADAGFDAHRHRVDGAEIEAERRGNGEEHPARPASERRHRAAHAEVDPGRQREVDEAFEHESEVDVGADRPTG